MDSSSDILLIGTGALATLFASRLSEAGYSITMLGTWGAGLEALRRDGARLVYADGSEHRSAVRVTDDPQQCRGAKHALVLVKSWQTERAARQLAICLAADGLALTLQNGLGNREILVRYLDGPFTKESTKITEKKEKRSSAVKKNSRVALGITTTGATLLGPGLVKAGGEGKISIEAHPALGPIEEALRKAKFNLETVQDAKALVWGKLVINAAINPLTALLRVPNGELLGRPSARELMRLLAEETASVARAEKVDLPFHDPAREAEEVARRTAANHSSMFQDVRRGAPTEIDAICGAIARTGEQHHLATPINYACWQLVQALTAR